MIAWLITSRIGRALAGAVALLLAIVTFGASERHKGRKQATEKMNEKDRKEADRIRSDVRDVGELHDDEIVYRD